MGLIVRCLPLIDGILGYSIGTLSVLVLAGTAIVYFLRRLGAGCLVCLLALVLVMPRAIMFPQFTVNAGLLGIAAVLVLLDADRRNYLLSLVAACLLGF